VLASAPASALFASSEPAGTDEANSAEAGADASIPPAASPSPEEPVK
jgi:hypothetical protein